MSIVQDVVQEIHAKIEAFPSETLSMIKIMKSKRKDEFYDEIKPSSLSLNEFERLAQRYQTYYPQNAFVTEKQVANICREYDLMLGDMFAFNAVIPGKNKEEMKRFKVLGSDVSGLGIHGIDWTEKGVSASSLDASGIMQMIIEKGLEVGTIEDAMIMMSTNLLQPRVSLRPVRSNIFSSESIVYLNENMGIKISRNLGYGNDDYSPFSWYSKTPPIYPYYFRENNQERFRADLIIQLHSDETDLTLTIPVDPRLVISVRKERVADFGFRSLATNWTKVDLDFNLLGEMMHQLFTRGIRKPYYHFVDKKVIAPIDMFSNAVFADGYKLRFDLAQYSNSISNIPDPIVLQPVQGGYLVITKWGDEAMYVKNPTSN